VQYQADKNLWVVLLLFLGLLLGVYRMKYPKAFESLFDASDIFRARLRESFFYELRILQVPNLIHYFSLAILFTLYVSKNWDALKEESLTLLNYHFALAIIFILSLTYPFLKFVLISFFSSLFGLNSFAKFHYIESIRLVIVVLSSAVLFSFIPINLLQLVGPNTLLLSLFVLSIGLVFMKLLNKSLDKKLYLFSYICTTEIIPLLFIVNFFKEFITVN
jgi:hypothetical protein